MKKPEDVLADLGRFSEPALLILISLADGPKHGYAMTMDIAAVSGKSSGPARLRRHRAARRAQVDRAAAGRRPPSALPADGRRAEGLARAARQPARGRARRPGTPGGELTWRRPSNSCVSTACVARTVRREFLETAGADRLSAQQVIDITMGAIDAGSRRTSAGLRRHPIRRTTDDDESQVPV
jgi:hypothetical protein